MYWAYLITWRIIGILPEKIAYGIGAIAADYIFKKNGKGVRRFAVIMLEFYRKSLIKS